MISAIISADLIVADLTDHNPNCFYELAIAHAYRVPVIHIIHEGQSMPFDIFDMRAIEYRTDDLDKADDAKQAVSAAVARLSKPGYEQRTPLTTARSIAEARAADRAEPALMAELLSELRATRDRLVGPSSEAEKHEAAEAEWNSRRQGVMDKVAELRAELSQVMRDLDAVDDVKRFQELTARRDYLKTQIDNLSHHEVLRRLYKPPET